MHKLVAVAYLVMILGVSSSAEFRYDVQRDKRWGREAGVLMINESGASYRSNNGKTVANLPFMEIHKIDISDPKKVRIWTYDRSAKRLTLRHKLELDLVEGTTSQDLAEFLVERLERPVLGAFRTGDAGIEIAAYHRHLLGGCDGALLLEERAIRFDSEQSEHARTWPFEDVATVGTTDPFHFRLRSYAETYTFDLKQKLPPEAYRKLWLRLYGARSPRASDRNELKETSQ